MGTHIEILVVLLIVAIAAYSLMRRLFATKAPQSACSSACGGGSCSGCSFNQHLTKHPPSPLAAPPKQRIIAIVKHSQQYFPIQE